MASKAIDELARKEVLADFAILIGELRRENGEEWMDGRVDDDKELATRRYVLGTVERIITAQEQRLKVAQTERDDWRDACQTNVEIIKQRQGVIEDLRAKITAQEQRLAELESEAKHLRGASIRPTSKQLIIDITAAVAVLNEKKWKDAFDWQYHSVPKTATSLSSAINYDVEDAIAIANSLITEQRIAELTAELASRDVERAELTAQVEGLIAERDECRLALQRATGSTTLPPSATADSSRQP